MHFIHTFVDLIEGAVRFGQHPGAHLTDLINKWGLRSFAEIRTV